MRVLGGPLPPLIEVQGVTERVIAEVGGVVAAGVAAADLGDEVAAAALALGLLPAADLGDEALIFEVHGLKNNK